MFNGVFRIEKREAMALSFFFFSPIPLPAIPSPFLSLPLGVPILKSNLEVWGVQALHHLG